MHEEEDKSWDERNTVTNEYVPFFQFSKLHNVEMEEKCKHHVTSHRQSPVRISGKEPVNRVRVFISSMPSEDSHLNKKGLELTQVAIWI